MFNVLLFFGLLLVETLLYFISVAFSICVLLVCVVDSSTF